MLECGETGAAGCGYNTCQYPLSQTMLITKMCSVCNLKSYEDSVMKVVEFHNEQVNFDRFLRPNEYPQRIF